MVACDSQFSGWALKRGADSDARDNVPGEDEIVGLHKSTAGQGKSPRRASRKKAAPNRRWQDEPDLPSTVLALPCDNTEGDALARLELFTDYFDPVRPLLTAWTSLQSTSISHLPLHPPASHRAKAYTTHLTVCAARVPCTRPCTSLVLGVCSSVR